MRSARLVSKRTCWVAEAGCSRNSCHRQGVHRTTVPVAGHAREPAMQKRAWTDAHLSSGNKHNGGCEDNNRDPSRFDIITRDPSGCNLAKVSNLNSIIQSPLFGGDCRRSGLVSGASCSTIGLVCPHHAYSAWRTPSPCSVDRKLV